MTWWRVVPLETHDCFYNMAMDQAVEEQVRRGRSPPTIRFYKWKPDAVSIGCFQSMRDEVNVPRCDELGVKYVRRRTGGGAVYHDSSGEITYSIIGPLELFPNGIRESYAMICGWVIDSLRILGVEAEFAPINDVTVDGKKISGNAQTRREGILLQHGTILYDLNVERMFDVLRVGKEKISDKAIGDVRERVTSVKSLTKASEEELYEALLGGFTDGKQFEGSLLNGFEVERANELAKQVYSTEEWNFSR